MKPGLTTCWRRAGIHTLPVWKYTIIASYWFAMNFRNTNSWNCGFLMNCNILAVVGCRNTVYTGTSGNIASPNYPQPYNNSENCTYSIRASQPSSFTLNFTSFNLESCGGSECTCDWVQVRIIYYKKEALLLFCVSTPPLFSSRGASPQPG